MKSIVKYLAAFTIFFYGCSSKIIQQISSYENLSSSMQFAADSGFFQKDEYWLDIPQISFTYYTLSGLDNNSTFMRKGDNAYLYINEPSVVNVLPENLSLLVYPYDSIIVSKGAFGNIEFSANTPHRTSELKAFTQICRQISDKISFSALSKLAEQTKHDLKTSENFNALKQLYVVQQTQLTAFIDSMQIADNLSSEYSAELKYYLGSRFFYFKVEYFSLIKSNTQLSVTDLQPLLAEANRLNLPGKLKYYFSSLKELYKLTCFINENDYRVYDSAQFGKSLKLIRKYFKGITADFLFTNSIYEAVRNKVAYYKKYKRAARKKIKNKIYRKYIFGIIANEKTASGYFESETRGGLTANNGSAVQSEDDVLKKYLGKIVLVDFWASWCIPCRREMPLMREIKNRYIGKDLVFLTISIDIKHSAWQNASKTEAVDTSTSFRLNSNNSVFRFKDQIIDTIPRYILLDRKGKIVNANCPPPGTDSLLHLLDMSLMRQEVTERL